MKLQMRMTLKSDTTFGRGDGIAGLVDQEVEHDSDTGLPYLRGRALKGLLAEECANILYALQLSGSGVLERYERAARLLFGKAGSSIEDDGCLLVGAAMLPRSLRDAVTADINGGLLTAADILDSITAIRRQTAVNNSTGTPERNSLRSMRVVLRETEFVSEFTLLKKPDSGAVEPDMVALLAACVASLRRAGIGRNRGRGQLTAELCDENGKELSAPLVNFRRLVMGEAV